MAAYRVSPQGEDGEVTIEALEKLNVAQQTKENKAWLDELGGIQGLAAKLKVDLQRGLTEEQAQRYREKYGPNVFPSPPMASWFEEFFDALKDPIVMVLIAAAAVSLIIGIIKDPHEGWIEGTAIVIAILLVGTVTATNNYNKERQFRSLEETAKKDDRVFIKRSGELKYVNPEEIVVGDLVKLKSGDGIPTDGILIEGEGVKANESSLTGEPDDLAKHHSKDPFLLSSSQLMSQGTTDELFYLTIAVGSRSQWGKIRANLVSEAAPTPLQEKLEDTAKFVGKVGTSVSILTFIALVVMIWVHYQNPPRTVIVSGVINAFIIAVTIIVVAIPEGLPLAVTISLAYSTKKMYADNNLIRVLAACETMGNATNICSDKTGTLTENRMTVVEGWFGTNVYKEIKSAGGQLAPALKDVLVTNIGVNSAANIIYKDEATGATLDRPRVIGSATEGALLIMIKSWGYDDREVKSSNYSKDTDKIYPFNSGKKRATAVILRKDGSVRVLVKGATEWVLNDCKHLTGADGSMQPLTDAIRKNINDHVLNMADRALRTLCIAHRDFPSLSKLPEGWEENPPDNADLVCDGIVGIIDPLRSDVKDAVKSAQMAGVMVRMVTGDNINTAKAIARDCGILTPGGLAIEGPVFRNLKPAEVDALLPRIQVMARSSPEDKFLMVTRLNGANLPKDEKSWLEKHPGRSWATEKDLLLPGYYDEWVKSRPDGGQVVGVTGDGTNDAPALKAADVGLSMGITGTQVAKNASDIVILDDKFSSIVRAIMWGRAVYDNIRKFLQFQLTVNVVALILVFLGAVTDRGTPLNAVMMLWVNLIMDTLGALALGTESPTPELLLRKPYKRSTSLISKPMWRNILSQAAYQLGILLFVLYEGPAIWGFESGNYCEKWRVDNPSGDSFSYNGNSYKCSDFTSVCAADYHGDTGHCYEKLFKKIKKFEDSCQLYCVEHDYTHYSYIFNIFVMCQVFNEYNAREIFNNPANIFKNLHKNPMFLGISVVTIGLQAMLVEVGGEFVKTTSLNAELWGWSLLFGLVSIPLGALIRVLLPLEEDPESFFGYEMPKEGEPIPDILKASNAPPGSGKVDDGHA